MRRGAFDDACVVYEDLRDELAARFGDEHEHVAEVLETLGGAARQEGDLAAARRYLERAREVWAVVKPQRAESVEGVLAQLDPLSASELARRPSLVVRHQRPMQTAGGPQAVMAMMTDVLHIGRGVERVHLWIHSDCVSRVHARVVWRPPDVFEIEDCRSENGTLYEGAMIDRRVIRDRDVYLLGGRERVLCQLGPR